MSTTMFTAKLVRGVVLISCLLLIQQICAVKARTLQERFEVVIITGKEQVGTVTDAGLQIQTEVAGVSFDLDTTSDKIAASKPTVSTISSLGIGSGVCFVSIQYTGGTSKEWFVNTITITQLDTKERVTFLVNKAVKIKEQLQVDGCKQRQQS